MQEVAKDRAEAARKYQNGNICFAKSDVNNILLAIKHYTDALRFLRYINEKDTTADDAKNIRDTLSALIKSFNKLVSLSFDGSHIVDELEKFLRFYMDTFKILNKNAQRMPLLTELNLKDLGVFFRQLRSQSEKGRAEIYLGIISLFHEDMVAARNLRSKPGDDAAAEKALALYREALILSPQPALVEPPVVVVAPEPKQKPLRVVKPMLAPRVPKFDQFAPPEKKREDIRVLMAMKNYHEAVKRSAHIFNRVASDYRCSCECYYHIGNEHYGLKKFQEAIESYKNALLQSKHIEKAEVRQEDWDAISKVFGALIKTLDEITREWSKNFVDASKSMANVLDFYLDYFDVFHYDGKKLPGLDEINIDNLISFMSEDGDKTQQEITKIYLTVIAMFRQEAKLQAGQLSSLVEELKIKKDELFQKALTLVQSTKHRELLNPELKTVSVPKLDCWKGASSSSSSLPPQYGLESQQKRAKQDRQDLATGASRTYSKK